MSGAEPAVPKNIEIALVKLACISVELDALKRAERNSRKLTDSRFARLEFKTTLTSKKLCRALRRDKFSHGVHKVSSTVEPEQEVRGSVPAFVRADGQLADPSSSPAATRKREDEVIFVAILSPSSTVLYCAEFVSWVFKILMCPEAHTGLHVAIHSVNSASSCGLVRAVSAALCLVPGDAWRDSLTRLRRAKTQAWNLLALRKMRSWKRESQRIDTVTTVVFRPLVHGVSPVTTKVHWNQSSCLGNQPTGKFIVTVTKFK
ncbi:hypothetical protein B0H16DRAFT_1483033 [Mycena metata]|uniref:Uncharacterized protein n=1 Tax=Mycena metata TaxID=1033252 RepID=A0AAD7DZF7_9AGAR|nr:hypothetical protein B0H16DRAFT_1483033 [Mycena metata]